MEVYDYNYSIGRGFGSTNTYKEGWMDGEVYTPHGIVIVYAQGDKNISPFVTTLRLMNKGVVYVRSFGGKRYSSRGIVTKAKQFAKEISEEK